MATSSHLDQTTTFLSDAKAKCIEKDTLLEQGPLDKPCDLHGNTQHLEH